MKDESAGNRYLRAVGHKGVEGMDWLVKDLHEELKSWGHMGGTGGSIVIKTDGESCSRRQRAADAQFDQRVFEPVGREGEH